MLLWWRDFCSQHSGHVTSPLRLALQPVLYSWEFERFFDFSIMKAVATVIQPKGYNIILFVQRG